jgi:hypothetical protein
VETQEVLPTQDRVVELPYLVIHPPLTVVTFDSIVVFDAMLANQVLDHKDSQTWMLQALPSSDFRIQIHCPLFDYSLTDCLVSMVARKHMDVCNLGDVASPDAVEGVVGDGVRIILVGEYILVL